jgi:HK97 family phage major capsid protein
MRVMMGPRETALVEEIRRLESEAAGEPFTDEQRGHWNELNEELDEFRTRRERILELAGRPECQEGEPVDASQVRPGRAVPRHLQETRSRGLRAVERLSGELSAAATDRLELVVEHDMTGPEHGLTARYLAAAADPDYREAFGHLLADPTGAHLRMTPKQHAALQAVNEVMSEQRALGIGTQGGAYPVPAALDPTVNLTSDGSVNPLRQFARVETITSYIWNGVNSAGISAAYAAEFTEASDNSPTLTQPTVQPEKAQAFIPFSIEAGEDWGSFQSEMAVLFADAKDQLEATKFLSGAGHASSEPQGLLVGATAVVTSAATATFAVADLFSVVNALPERWQPNASIVASRAVLNKVRQFDTAGGASLWTTLGNGTPERLLGYQTSVYSAMSTQLTTTGASILTVGDFKQFLIVDRIGMNVEIVQHLFATANNRPYGARGL